MNSVACPPIPHPRVISGLLWTEFVLFYTGPYPLMASFPSYTGSRDHGTSCRYGPFIGEGPECLHHRWSV